MRRVVASILALAAVAFPDGDPPRYRFDLGQELVYKTTSVDDHRALWGALGETVRRSAETRLWVVRKNGDGSVRLCVRHSETQGDGEPQVEFGWCDLHPGGRAVLGPTLGASFDPSAIFKPLPPAGVTEWQARGTYGERLRLKIGKDGAIEETVESGRFIIWGATCTSRCVIAEGLPQTIQAARSKGKSDRWSAFIQLHSCDWNGDDGTFDKELASYSAARDRALRERLQAEDIDSLMFALERARMEIVYLLQGAKTPVVRKELARLAAYDDIELAGSEWVHAFRKWKGVEAPDWTLADLDGKRHALGDCRGKIVVLDFWSAECGPCLMAMPALKELASRHEGKLVVLGMNKDATPEEARQVAEGMEIGYPTLRAREVVEAYGVTDLPTTFVLDGEGVVRHVFVGFGPSFAAELEVAVVGLLPPLPRAPSPR